MICPNDISSLKNDISEKIGEKILIKWNIGKTKSFEKEAIISKVYPNIFSVVYEENNRNVTYSYTDILTRNIELHVYDGENYNPIIPPPPPIKRRKISENSF